MSTLATDPFTRGNAANLGANWTIQTTKIAIPIVSNAASLTEPVNDGAEAYTAIAWPNDQYSQANLTSGSQGSPGVAVRLQTGANTVYWVSIDHEATLNAAVLKFVTGSATALSNITNAYTDGDLFRLEVQGSTLVVKQNGTTVGGLGASDSAITSGNAGLYYNAAGAGATTSTWDYWEGGDFGVAIPPGDILLFDTALMR